MNKTNDFKYNLPAYSDPVDIEDLNDNFRGIDDALMAGLCKKDYTGNNMGSSDPSARKYAWAPWFEIVNDNEFDVVVTDRNAPVESEEATINIAAGQTFRKYINGRYYMNFYVQDQHDVTFKWFTNAETYINESGGGGGGTGTVTSVSVQGGSGSHLTASGNPIETSGTITINVDEGYSIPSDNEQTAWDGKAADLKAEIDSSTYVLTLQLKDSSGNLIGNERTIDLPLETMVVDGEYDPQTQKIKLELKNGNYVEFSVADLVSGLQTELSASNKLDPDYIDYDSSHRAVSDTEKNTWSAKQNAISDLETIRSGAAAGATAVQPSAMEDALDTKQDSLDSTQLAAVNSGINSTKVDQISTNQTNILYAANRTGKNVLRTPIAYEAGYSVTIKGITYTVQDDYSIKVNGTCTASSGDYSTFVITSSTLHADDNYGHEISGFMLNGCPNLNGDLYVAIERSNAPYTEYAKDTGSGDTIDVIPAGVGIIVFVRVPSGKTINNAVVYPMIRPAFTDDTYQSPSLPNYDLTYLQAEDRAALAEEIDAGAKNKLDWANTIVSNNNATGTKTETSLTVASASTIYGNCSFGTPKFEKASRVVFSFSVSAVTTASRSRTMLQIYSTGGASGNPITDVQITGTGKYSLEFDVPANTSYYAFIYPSRDTVQSGNTITITDLMVSTKAAFGVSQKFVPYVPNMYDYQWQAISTYFLARRSGRTVTINGFIANISFTANTATLIGNVNTTVGRPHESVRTLCNVGANAYTVGTLGYLVVQQDGNIYVTSTYEGTGVVYVSLSYTI